MKRFTSQTHFCPVTVTENKWETVKDKTGKPMEFKTRKSVETYCSKNKCIYVEVKHIFYR